MSDTQIRGAVPYEDVAVKMYADDPQLAADMLNDCLRQGETQEFLFALRQIVKAYGGLPEVAKATGLHEKTLYKSLNQGGNPTLKTLMGIASTLHMNLTFVPQTRSATTLPA